MPETYPHGFVYKAPARRFLLQECQMETWNVPSGWPPDGVTDEDQGDDGAVFVIDLDPGSLRMLELAAGKANEDEDEFFMRIVHAALKRAARRAT